MLDQETRQWVAESITNISTIGAFDSDQLQFKLIHAADRDIYRIDVPGLERFLVLKIWSTDKHGKPLKKTSGSVRGEYEKTQLAYQTWSKVGQNSNFIAEPVAVSDSKRALLLTGCPGEDFSKYLNRKLLIWPFVQGAIAQRFHAAGEWLGHFHSASMRVEDGTEYIDIRRTHLTRMLDVIQNGVPDSSFGRSIATKFNDSVNAESVVPVVLIHGNYALRNLLVTDDSISSIDFEESRRECSAYDVGQFVAEIIVRGFIPTFSRTFVDNSVQKFLDGYSVLSSLDAKLLHAFVGYHLVAFYFEHTRRAKLNLLSRLRCDHIRRALLRWQL